MEEDYQPLALLDTASDEDVFHRARRIGCFSGLMMLAAIYGLSGLFIFIWVYSGRLFSPQAIFGVFGVFIALFCLRGVWAFLTGPVVHFVTFERDTIRWGYLGRDEKSLAVSSVQSFRWLISVDNELDFSILKTDGKRARLHYIDSLLTVQDRRVFEAFLHRCYPQIPIDTR